MSDDKHRPNWSYLVYLSGHPAVIIVVTIALIGIIATCTLGPPR